MDAEKVTLEPLTVKLATAAKMLDVGRTTIWRLCKEGRLVTVRVRQDQRITIESIKRLVTEQVTAAAKPVRRAR